jgi:hypothetical protein
MTIAYFLGKTPPSYIIYNYFLPMEVRKDDKTKSGRWSKSAKSWKLPYKIAIKPELLKCFQLIIGIYRIE